MNDAIQSSDQSVLLAALRDPTLYPDTAGRIDEIETHISHVFLAGSYAYKVKKAIDLGFLDFTTLPKRHFYCQEELRLNRRLAPEIYLDVVPITGPPDRPRLGGTGTPIEYAVKMRRFAQEDLLDSLLARDRLTREHVERLAAKIASFHASAAVAAVEDVHGSADAVRRPALENFSQIRNSPAAGLNSSELYGLELWTVHQCQALDPVFRARKGGGFVRECHGDFHLGNVALVGDEATIFDCLEFDANLRWIDVMSEAAFLLMDLYDKKRPDLAQHFLNRYLEITADYAGLAVLRFYLVYRAMVRAKVNGLRAAQPDVDARQKAVALAQYRNYSALAKRHIEETAAAVIITHGLSGSGKTTNTDTLLEATTAVRIRSDVERKRLHALPARARSRSKIQEQLYTPEATARTYRRLTELAKTIVQAGYIAIVDATFLERRWRDTFSKLAVSLRVRFLILDFVAPENILRARVAARQHERRDASEADTDVLEHQLTTQEPLCADELSAVRTFDAKQTPTRQTWGSVLAALGLRPAR